MWNNLLTEREEIKIINKIWKDNKIHVKKRNGEVKPNYAKNNQPTNKK